MRTWVSACGVYSLLAVCLAPAHLRAQTLGGIVGASDVTLRNGQHQTALVHRDGSYELVDDTLGRSLIHTTVAAEIDHRWVHSSDYPEHEITKSSYEDVLGPGQQVSVKCTGVASQPNLVYLIRLYDHISAGDIVVNVQNESARTATVQAIRPVEAVGPRFVNLGESEQTDRVLSDSFSEDWPPLRIYDLAQAPGGMHLAVGSQLIYNRASKEALFFGALTSERFLTIMHLRVTTGDAGGDKVSAYTIDSTGTTEIQATDPESGLRHSPKENLIELSLPLPSGGSMSSERLMFDFGKDYYSILGTYGASVRRIHHSRIAEENIMGWWSWTAFYTRITEGNVCTNAQWLAEHLEKLGYKYLHLDLGYAYARGEYATPNASHFPHGLIPLTQSICRLGLKMGFWTAPFEVDDKSWIYEHQKDWLVHNAEGGPIQIGEEEEVGEFGKGKLFVLDTTNPAAQQYLRKTYQILVNDWGARYIKLDFMDNTAIEGYYHRPNTTALEAQRIGLQIIREAVGEHVLLDKDGSPMLNPVGYLDEGRLSQDTGHTFLRSKEAAPGIAARYYMHDNFFLSDPDAFTVSRQMIEQRRIQAPLSLNEARVSIALAAVAGGMFEIGDDLPTLGQCPTRVALVTNPDLLQMVRLRRVSIPLDLMNYRAEDEQPSIFLLQEDQRQHMLAVFNWTEQPRSHSLSLSGLNLSSSDRYRLTDVFEPGLPLPIEGGTLSLADQPAHSVRLIKMVDESIPAAAPSISASVPANGMVGENLRFAGSASEGGVPVLAYHWEFGDGVTADGVTVTHTYTLGGKFTAHLTADGVDGIPWKRDFPVDISGAVQLLPPRRYTVSQP